MAYKVQFMLGLAVYSGELLFMVSTLLEPKSTPLASAAAALLVVESTLQLLVMQKRTEP